MRDSIFLSIRNDRQMDTGRGIAWSCDLHVNGRKAAEARNAGDGGMTVVTWVDDLAEASVRAYARKHPITVMDNDITLEADGEGPEWDGTYILALAECKGATILKGKQQ